jgi:hypothetical protein
MKIGKPGGWNKDGPGKVETQQWQKFLPGVAYNSREMLIETLSLEPLIEYFCLIFLGAHERVALARFRSNRGSPDDFDPGPVEK